MLLVGAGCEPRVERPHILLITADALRADHLSLNGYPRATSPALDRFARDATHFDQAISVIPKTGPSFATLFTGRYPDQHGVQYNQASLPHGIPVLAERFKSLGYRTAAFISNPVLRASKGYARGFDVYRELPSEGGVREVNRAYFEWSESAFSEPTFVWVHYIDPHGPYDPPAELVAAFMNDALFQSDIRVPLDDRVDVTRGRSKVLGAIPKYQQRGREDRLAWYLAQYDAEIRHVDRAFGEIVEELESRDLYQGSAVVFTSDHGESLGEHDFYFEHGWFAFDASLRVPLMIKWPGQQAGEKRSHAVSQLDLMPTLLKIAGWDAPLDGAVGIDLAIDPGDRDPVSVENAFNYPERTFGLRSPEFKYLIREHDGREELYDLRTDPGETKNLAGSAAEGPAASSRYGEVLSGFREQADGLRRSGRFEIQNTGPPESIDEASRRALESLGYIDPAE
jgi:arylsulfatase A-like enzyme